MKITLISDTLNYVSLGTGKIHAQEGTGVVLSTLCGRKIPQGAEVRPYQRALSSENLCGRCTRSLMTYTGRMGTTPMVMVEREVEA